jgi:nitrate/nitrite transporter NarK
VPDAAGVMRHTLNNPNAPPALTYAWIGPFVGALIRPVGGWIADKVGGSIVTQIVSAVMVAASAAVGYVMLLAYGSATPEQYFLPFMALFVLLFAASGIGNGSTFRTIGVIRPGAGMDLGRGRLRRLHRTGGDRRPDHGGIAAAGHVRLRRVLRAVPVSQLVVLPARQRLREEPLSRAFPGDSR